MAADVRARVQATVEAVPDPEMPAVTIGMLGMVHALSVDGAGHVAVELLPTFAGCPATDMIRADVEAAVRTVPEVTGVDVVFRYSLVWTPVRIDDEGRRRLAEFGIAPPRAGTEPGRGALAGTAGGAAGAGNLPALPILEVVEGRDGSTEGRACPWCGSVETERDSAFGPTPCRDLWMCHGCRQPFEGFKSA